MTAPLSGIKILDFTGLLPGPYGSMMLADLGADIIKIENPANPDPVRLMPPMVNGVSALYAHLNRGKRSLCLDLKNSRGADVVRALVADYDIVLEQFRPGVMARLGLGYDDLRAINPRVIYCSLSGYAQTGPLARRAGNDINYCALSGMDSYSGRKDAGPCPLPVQVADICGGAKNMVIAVLAAHIRRLSTGRGDCIDLSLADSAFALTVFSAAGCLAGGREPGREEELLNGGSLYDYYRTGDGRYLSVGPLEQKFFTAFCAALGRPDLAGGGILANLSDPSVKTAIADIIASETLEHWTDLFSATDACVEPVLTLAEACDSALFADRNMIVEVPCGSGGTVPQIGNPIGFAGSPGCITFAGTAPGAHTDEILLSLGYDREAIAFMKQEGLC
jgi:crotonobetainyl-CoA:carnitine CoA-transferase CaiB-like acyl-CoA transferase